MLKNNILNFNTNSNLSRMILIFTCSLLFVFSSCFSDGKKIESEILINKNITEDTILENQAIVKRDTFKNLIISKVIQSKVMNPKAENSVYEPAINSPKSVTFTKDGKKFYVNSLEGFTTIVFDSKEFKKLKEIRHEFTNENNKLFKNNEQTVFDYKFKQKKKEYNHFLGKPVESTLSHNGKYLWVTYYRRDWDPKAESPSAIAIIDTESDEIIRVMPSGPLPKMIACSNDNKYIAVTHWGDNTVALIDINSENVMDFKYTDHIVVDYRLVMDFNSNSNRDSECGNCLRGTIFTPDSKKLLIAKMGGNGIAVIDLSSKKMLGTITGSYLNLRHLLINSDNLYLSSNKFGMVQKGSLNEILITDLNEQNLFEYNNWKSTKLGAGVRTIDITKNGDYIFACVNNTSKIAVIHGKSMEKIFEIDVASFPVGMALSPDESKLIVTSQGKSSTPGSGNTVTVFDVNYN